MHTEGISERARRAMERRLRLGHRGGKTVAELTGFSPQYVSNHLHGARYNVLLEVYVAGRLGERIDLKGLTQLLRLPDATAPADAVSARGVPDSVEAQPV